jgi:patatin-like phospholipase/acyl hydrolase
MAIDGGGVRCYLPLKLLNEVEKRTKMSVCELFDYFTGVSASSLICSLLLLKGPDGKPRFSAEQILNIFREECKKIFSYSYLRNIKTAWGLLAPTYTNDNFQKILSEYFQNTVIGDLIKPLCIISFDIITDKNYYFNFNEFGHLLVKDCILCSTAAPTYFYPYKYNFDNLEHAFIDGGVIANNPAELCFIKASEYFKNDDFYTLSIGTGYSFSKSVPSCGYGLLGWSKNIINTLFDANNQTQISELSMLNVIVKREKKTNTMNRIDFQLEKDINLDDVNSFDMMESVMDKWIKNNNGLIDELCTKLVNNYHSKISNSIL